MVVIGPGEGEDVGGAVDPVVARAVYEELAGTGLNRRDALREAARRLGVSRKELYDALLGDEMGE